MAPDQGFFRLGAEGMVPMSPNPLLAELQQGRKMQSLDWLASKLGQDQQRHAIHVDAVQRGLTMVEAAQTIPSLITSDYAISRPGTALLQHPASSSSTPIPGASAALVASSASTPTPGAAATYAERVRAQVMASRDDGEATDLLALSAAEVGDSSAAGAYGPSRPAPPPGPPPAHRPSPAMRHRVHKPVGEPDSGGARLAEIEPQVNDDTSVHRAPVEDEFQPPQLSFSIPAGENNGDTGHLPQPDLVVSGSLNFAPQQAPVTPTIQLQMAIPQGESRADEALQLPSTMVVSMGTVKYTDTVPIVHSERGSGQDASQAAVSMSQDAGKKAITLEHKDEVMALAFSPDGTRLLTGGEDMQVVLWDVLSQSRLFSVNMDGAIKAVAYSPCGRYIAVADTDSFLTVWDASDDCKEVNQQALDGEINTIAFCHSSPRLAVGTASRKVILLTVPELDEIESASLSGDVQSLSFSPDGQFLAAGGGTAYRTTTESKGCQAVVWRLAGGGAGSLEQVVEVEYSDVVYAVAFSPNGASLAIASQNRNLSLHSVRDAFQLQTEYQCHSGVRTIAWSSDSCFVASAGEDMQITVWNMVKSQVEFQLPKASDWYCSIAFDSSDAYLAACGFGNQCVVLHPVHVRQIAQDQQKSDSKLVASLEVAKNVTFQPPMDLDAGKSLGTVKFDSELSGQRRPSQSSCGIQLHVEWVRETSDGNTLVARMHEREALGASFGDDDGDVQFKLLLSDRRDHPKLKHNDEVVTLAFNPGGRTLVAGGEDNQLIVWDIDEISQVFSTKMSSPVSVVAYSACGTYFAAATADSQVSAWRGGSFDEVGMVSVNGTVLCMSMSKLFLAVGTSATAVVIAPEKMDVVTQIGFDGDVRSLSWSSDGVSLAVAGGMDAKYGLMTNKQAGTQGMKAAIWRVSTDDSTPEEVVSLPFTDVIHSVAFAPSGKVLAVAGEDKVISLLIVDQDLEKSSEYSCPAGVRCLSWSRDSRFLASAGEDMQITVWDLVSERIAFQLPKAVDWYCSLAFSPCGAWLASCGYGDQNVSLHAIEMLADPKDVAVDRDSDNDAPAPVVTIAVPSVSSTAPAGGHFARGGDVDLLNGVGSVKLDAAQELVDRVVMSTAPAVAISINIPLPVVTPTGQAAHVSPAAEDDLLKCAGSVKFDQLRKEEVPTPVQVKIIQADGTAATL